jgi:hypothetical protein
MFNPWRERNVRALEALASEPWAQGLLKRVRKLGITLAADDTLFELRYAHDLARAGVAPVYEHRTGVGNSTVDFKLPEKVPWLVELVSIRESDAMKAATVEETIGHGIRTQTLLLTSTAGISDPSKKKQTQQEELLRVVHKLGEKAYDGTKPIKFPVPDGSAFHMLLVDMRGFEGFGEPDRDHCRQIVGGPRRHPEESCAPPIQDRQAGPASSAVRAALPSRREDQDEQLRQEAAGGPLLTERHCI